MLTIAVLVFVSIPSIAAVVGWSLTHPERELIEVRPESFDLTYEEIEFHSERDNILLKGWLIPTENKKKIVIFAHGYADNRSNIEAALPTAKALYDKGIPSLLFDFQNSGESEGTVTSVGHFEKADLLAAVNFLKTEGYEEVIFIGYSMGAVVSLITAPDVSEVKAVVADSPFSDLRSYLEDNLPVWSGLPAFPFTPLIMAEMPLLTGIDMDQVRPIEAVQNLGERPLLLIHTKDDNKIPSTNSEEIYKVSNSPHTELWMTPGTEHIGSYNENPEEYLNKIILFVEKSFQ
ncbi:alpha/beta hydrolase [Bacillus taeanensis]|uniref:Alpha/beta hydrolase n=2 Tax=Bacillus taeanensis TaxID=273032 RepID=A0A366Y1C2_9BACI|nr:alpha/beta hydrolase [Bacillus taeanensis]